MTIEGRVKNDKDERKKQEKSQYTIRFPPEAVAELDEMAKKEGVTRAELIRRAINFYQVKLRAKSKNRRVVLEDADGGEKEWVML